MAKKKKRSPRHEEPCELFGVTFSHAEMLAKQHKFDTLQRDTMRHDARPLEFSAAETTTTRFDDDALEVYHGCCLWEAEANHCASPHSSTRGQRNQGGIWKARFLVLSNNSYSSARPSHHEQRRGTGTLRPGGDANPGGVSDDDRKSSRRPISVWSPSRFPQVLVGGVLKALQRSMHQFDVRASR